MKHLENTHDLRLPAWGPYTKNYAGISHLPEVSSGVRFDLSVFPGFYRGKVNVPNVKWESGFHPWEAAADLSYFCNRHELLWKDQVYADVSFSCVGDEARLIRCEAVNNTDLPQTLVLHYVASIHFPSLRPNFDEPIEAAVVSLPEGAVWWDALEYDELRFATPRPTDNLVPDGRYRGEVRGHGFVGGRGVGQSFGWEAGDFLAYAISLDHDIPDAALLIRCRTPQEGRAGFCLSGLANAEVEVAGGPDFRIASVPVGDLEAGEHGLQITASGGAALELDGFILCPAAQVEAVRFTRLTWGYQPELLPGASHKSLRLRYQDAPGVEYGIAWDWEDFKVRQLHADELDRFMPMIAHQHVQTTITDHWASAEPEGHFTNVFLRPISLEPHGRRVLYGLVCSGSPGKVQERLADFERQGHNRESIYERARAGAARVTGFPGGDGYAFSQEKMAATVLTNLVYPIYLRGTYIRHYTPGRWWDSLYTWDSGFVGLGLLQLDVERAIDCLNAYMTEPGDTHAAFIHHGSPVPVQHYLFLDLWNRTTRQDVLEHFYPRLKQYHEFLAGRLGSSTTRVLRSKLLKTWDYFYNSGGWDDYPPQVHVHREGWEDRVTPASNTCHAIRTAKILRMAANALGKSEDADQYYQDIRVFTEALQSYAWDREEGYFSYVVHDDDGLPAEILLHESGANFNRGLDGAYALVAGICTAEQEERLFGHLENPEELWSPVGLSTVDQSAPYYRADGYWNGAVWLPHQWLFWKACLDLGRPELAWRIAETGLKLWQREVGATYNCYEHFIIATGRGAGWHQFSGLSSPVLAWYDAYFGKGRLTCGLDVWAEAVHIAEDAAGLEAELRTYGASDRLLNVIASLDPRREYRATWNGEQTPAQRLPSGALNVYLPCADEGKLRIVPV